MLDQEKLARIKQRAENMTTLRSDVGALLKEVDELYQLVQSIRDCAEVWAEDIHDINYAPRLLQIIDDKLAEKEPFNPV